MVLAYLRRHHIGLLALVIALGGTSYAVTQLPKNSVGSQQIQKQAVTKAKLAKKVRAQLASAGAPGTPGPPGAPGATGPQGPPGDEGPAGPTSGGVGGPNTTVTVPAGTPTLTSVTVTLTEPGKVLVLLTGTFSVRCTTADDCDRVLSVQVGGTTVPGAFATVNGVAGLNTEMTIDTAGVLTGVPAGTHTVSLASQITGPSNGSGSKGDIRLVAIALGPDAQAAGP